MVLRIARAPDENKPKSNKELVILQVPQTKRAEKVMLDSDAGITSNSVYLELRGGLLERNGVVESEEKGRSLSLSLSSIYCFEVKQKIYLPYRIRTSSRSRSFCTATGTARCITHE